MTVKTNFHRVMFVCVAALTLSACKLGSSDSGADQVPNTEPGDAIPEAFLGTYVGTADVVAEADAINRRESDSFEITITVTDDGRVRFDGDDPDETFTVGIANDGTFSGNLRVDDRDVKGTLGVTGRVDGSTASGDIIGEGEYDTGLVIVAVDVTGTFNAVKQ